MNSQDQKLADLVSKALAEDIGLGDCTGSAVIPEGAITKATIFQKASGVIFGFTAAYESFRQCNDMIAFTNFCNEGQWREVKDGQPPLVVCEIEGDARAILAAERTALNFLAHLSGIATTTARVVRSVAGTGVKILDTRKTTPGLRLLEKAAVKAGGGMNHRMGLYDAILIKENHIALAGGIQQAIAAARKEHPYLKVEVECETKAQIETAVRCGAERILLDNMGPRELQVAVNEFGEAVELEASGGVSLENVRTIAQTGVDFISMGTLTHSAPALDLSLIVTS